MECNCNNNNSNGGVIPWVRGNRLPLIICVYENVVTQEQVGDSTLTVNEMTRVPYTIQDNDTVTVIMKSGFRQVAMPFTTDGNKVMVTDNGELPTGAYTVEVTIERGDGARGRWQETRQVRIYENTSDAQLGEMYSIDADLFFYAKGDTGTGIADITNNPDGTLTITMTDGTSYVTEALKGDKGDKGDTGERGVSIVEFDVTGQTDVSVIYTVTFSDDTTQDISVPKGPQGDTGLTGNGISSTTLNSDYTLTIAYTDGTTYTTPSIRGAQGAQGVSVIGFTQTGETATNTMYNLVFSDGRTQSVAIPKGVKGDKGDTGNPGSQGAQGPKGDTVIIGDEQEYTLYGVTGQNTDGAMTQKAVTDSLVGSSIAYDNSESGLAATDVQDALDEMDDNFHLGSGVNERINLSEYTTLQTYPNVGGGNKWLTNNSTYPYTGKFIPITAGQQYKIVAQESRYCQYALLLEDAYTNHAQGVGVQYATGCNRTDVAAGTSVIITAPEDAAYLYVAVYVGSDITPSAVFEYPNISIKEYIQDMDEEPTEGSSNLVSSGGVHEVIQDLNDNIESINSAVLDATYAVDSTTTLNLTCNHSTSAATYKQYYKFTIGKKYRITLSVESAASEIIQLADLPRTGFTPWVAVMFLPKGNLSNTVIYTPSSTSGYLQAYSDTTASNGKAVTAVIEELFTLQDVSDDLVSIKSDINTNSTDIDKIEDQVYYESGMTYKSYTGNRITPNRIGFKAIGSVVTGQSAAVFGDIAFVFGNGGRNAAAFNMKTRTVASSYVPINGAPSKTDGTAWHCNSSEFGTNYYDKDDEFPLLYIGGSQGDAIHELLVCRVVPDSTRVYHLDVVQVLTMPNSWGYANVAFDEERGKIVLCSIENGTLNDTRIMIFRVCNPPAVVDGGGNPISTYTFTEEDVEQTITMETPLFKVAQDMAMHRGLLYLGQGHGAQDNAFFRVIDLYNGTLINDISIVGWFTDAAEGYSFYNEHMYIFGSSNVYKFWFM